MGLYYKGDNLQGAVAEGGGGNTYSSQETVIGTWENADGTTQPLYRKTISGDLTGDSDNWATINNMKHMIFVKGCVIDCDSSTPIPHAQTNNNLSFSATDGVITVRVGTWLRGLVVMAVEYTKTTDTPQ